MATLVLKNQELETNLGTRDLASITDGLIHGTTPIPDVDIREINTTPNYYYASNNLICLLDDGSPTAERFGGPEIRVNGFWKMKDTSSDGSEFGKYERFETPVQVEVFTPGRISIKIAESDREDVEEAYRSRGLTKPDYGMLLVVLNFVNSNGSQRREYAYLLKYTHSPIFSNFFIPLGSFSLPAPTTNVYRSPPYSAETFFVPQLSSSFVYNFFEPQEAEYSLYAGRDYRRQRTGDIPKYIKLSWNKPSFDSARFETDNTPPLGFLGFLPSLSGANIGALFGITGSSSTGSSGITTEAVSAAIAAAMAASGSFFFNFFQATGSSTPAPPPESSESESGGAMRIGGIIVSQAVYSEEVARLMSDAGTRTGAQAAGVFDGASGESSGGTAGTVQLSEEAQQQLQDAANTTFIDEFQTNILRDLEISVARNSDYVGYVVEKGRLTEDGEFEVVDMIAIAGKNTTEFLDWKIGYGETYRYRIRTVFRFVNKHNLSMFADSDSAISRQQSAQYVDTNTLIQASKTFYFDSVYSDSAEVQATENQRPNVPVNLRLFPDSRKKQLFLTWNQKNQNRDVVGFNVYRKILKENGQPFVRLNQDLIGIRENFLIDTDIEQDLDYIYAVEAVDFHGNFSQLSAQYYSRIQEVIVDERVCERPQKFFAVEGEELGEVPDEEIPSLMLCKRNMTLNVNPLFQNTDENNTFVIRVTCLDTGHKKEIKVNFRTMTIYHMSGYVPAQPQQYLPFAGALGFFDAATLANLVREFGNRS